MVPRANGALSISIHIFLGFAGFFVPGKALLSPVCPLSPVVPGGGQAEDFFYFPGNDADRDLLHPQAVVDVLERRLIVRMTGTRHDVIRGDLGLSKHSQVRMAQAVEVEAMNAHVADFLALVSQCARLDIFAVRLGADKINAFARSSISLLEGNDLLDRAALIVFRGDQVIIEVVAAIEKLIFGLLLPPAFEKRRDDLLIEREYPKASLRLWLADVVEAVMPTHGKTLQLLMEGHGQTIDVAGVPGKAQGFPDTRPEVQAKQERHVKGIPERIPLENLPELLILNAPPGLTA